MTSLPFSGEVQARYRHGSDEFPFVLLASVGTEPLVLLQQLPAGPTACLEAADAERLGLLFLDCSEWLKLQSAVPAGPFRLLPRLTLNGRRFVIDDQLGEIRAEDDPNHRFAILGNAS